MNKSADLVASPGMHRIFYFPRKNGRVEFFYSALGGDDQWEAALLGLLYERRKVFSRRFTKRAEVS